MHLDGLRVVDLSRVLAGPYCTALLGDLGAEVIKIEMPGGGDDARHFGPFRNGESLYFSVLNRNKKSISLNLKDPDGLAIVRDLVRRSDIVVENFRPGVSARLGVDYEALRAIKPDLVYASISGFGQDGPAAQLPAYDLIVQAASGLMSITGQQDSPPTRVGESVADVVAGLYASWAIMAALVRRERTGEGEHVDVAMLDSLMALQVTATTLHAATGVAPGRIGNRHPVSAPFDTFQAQDGLVVLVAANGAMFSRLAHLIDKPELVSDARFRTDGDRSRHERELKALIEEWTRARSVASVVDAAQDVGVPASPILDIGEALSTEQAKARRVVKSFDHPVAGVVPVVAQPIKFSGGTHNPERSPLLGEHTEEVLTRLLGFDGSVISGLRDRGVV
jgi:CoA:oxalate CoA-transferase